MSEIIKMPSANNIPVMPIVMLGAAGMGIYFMYSTGKKFSELFNISDSKEEKKAKAYAEQAPDKNPFSIYYSNSVGKGKNVYSISKDSAVRLAKRLKTAIGWIGLDFTKVKSVFSDLKFKTQVCSLAREFRALYGMDLLEYLRTGGNMNFMGLYDKELDSIINYVNNLPVGIVPKK